MATTRSILVTGATGFVGRHVVAGLGGCKVTAAVRSAEVALPAGVRPLVVGPIDSRTDWRAALAGIDAVVHLAGVAHRSGRFQAENADFYFEVNAHGTLRLAEAAAAAGVRDFVFASSIAVNGNATDGRAPFRESDVPAPVGPYGESKVAAEHGLAEIAGRTGMAVTAFRPPLVHGRGAPGNMARLEAAIRRGIPLPLAAIRNRRAFLGIDNLVDFVNWRLAQTNSGFEAFIVADDEQPSTPEFVAALADVMGARARLLPFPVPVLRALLAATGKSGMAESLVASLAVDTTKVHAAGWRPPFSLREGLARAFANQATTVS
jgi:UDP-glucose 4-epimerase